MSLRSSRPKPPAGLTHHTESSTARVTRTKIKSDSTPIPCQLPFPDLTPQPHGAPSTLVRLYCRVSGVSEAQALLIHSEGRKRLGSGLTHPRPAIIFLSKSPPPSYFSYGLCIYISFFFFFFFCRFLHLYFKQQLLDIQAC